MLKESQYKVSINRSYYAIFYAMRAVTALTGYDSSKHSGIIAYFNQNFVKTGDFDKDSSKIVKMASFLRKNQIMRIFTLLQSKKQKNNWKMRKYFFPRFMSI